MQAAVSENDTATRSGDQKKEPGIIPFDTSGKLNLDYDFGGSPELEHPCMIIGCNETLTAYNYRQLDSVIAFARAYPDYITVCTIYNFDDGYNRTLSGNYADCGVFKNIKKYLHGKTEEGQIYVNENLEYGKTAISRHSFLFGSNPDSVSESYRKLRRFLIITAPGYRKEFQHAANKHTPDSNKQ